MAGRRAIPIGARRAPRRPRAAARADAGRHAVVRRTSPSSASSATREMPGCDPPRPPMVILPYSIVGQAQRILAVRSAGNPNLLLNPVRAEVRAIDAEQPLGRPITLSEILGEEVVQPRFTMALFSDVRRARPRARGGRHLQRPVVPCDAPNARTRRAHGARRAAQPRAPPDADDGRPARTRRPHRRHGGELRLERLLRSLLFGVQPADPVAYAAVTLVLGVDRTPRVLRPGETRGPGRSDGGAAPGLRVGSDIHR